MAENVQSYDNLFGEFAPSTREEWLEATIKSLKGKPFEKLIKSTYEGFDLEPMYRAEDIADIAHKDTLPGQFPFVRGTEVDGYRSQPWLIAQDINISDPKAFNEALKHDLARGQTAIYVGNHLNINTIDDFSLAFADIDLTQYPIYFGTDNDATHIYSGLADFLNDEIKQLQGAIGYDPLHELAKTGEVSTDSFDAMAQLTTLVSQQSPKIDTIAIRTNIYHDAGANAVQELAIAMATGVTYISHMLDRGLEVDTIAQKMRFFLSIGENFFMEIAKLRAIKMMWAQIVREFGGNAESQKIKLHASTGTRNKTRLDPHVNMLRVTTEAMAGAIGGVESMCVAPFDASLGESDEFSRRIARNVQLILKEEVNLTDVIDPAGGSWYVEHLTDQLAQSAWEFFQQIEGQGGMISALQNGFLNDEIHKTLMERIENLHSRREILIGTNMYPNPNEASIPDEHTLHSNTQSESDSSKENLLFALRFTSFRIALPFEVLRSISDQYRTKYGHHPQIFLANFGKLSEYKARRDFTQGFYEVGGFELINQGGYDTVESAVGATITSGAGAVVICSTDAKYADVVPEFTRAIKAQNPDMIVILAGYPKDQVDEYRQAGVDDFIHIRANCYEMNSQLQDRLGVGS